MRKPAFSIDASELRRELHRTRSHLHELNKIGMALMSERDPDRLLGLILTQARRLTTSDAGSLYLVEEGEEGHRLHFLRSQNDTLPDLTSPDFTLPLDETSVAGYVASIGEPLVLEDVYEVPATLPFTFNKAAFDEEFGYRAKSMLAVPMMDHKDRVVGVLQLINRKSDAEASVHTEEDAERWVLPYTEREVDVVHSLAGQAAVSIENTRLHRDIERLFEGFIKAAVTAIDRRDPTTSGHSVRVTELTCQTARLIHRQTEGPFADVTFSDDEMKQLRYAGLLHDFGKVGVPEEILVKGNKLPPKMEVGVEARFLLIRRTLESDAHQARAMALAEEGQEGAAPRLEGIEEELARRLAELDRYREAVEDANVPEPTTERASELLDEMAGRTFPAPDDEDHPYLTQEELRFLRIEHGSLDEAEREQIQAHVLHSYDFLQNIPWTDELSRIAEIVRGHHERLDGSGYPDGIGGERLALETRIMMVCDVFDALTASDRPYRKAMSVEEALQILRREADKGALDADVVELFATSGVYERVVEADWREL